MSGLFYAVPRRLKLVLLALAVVPCAPGTIFLVAGWVRHPRRPVQPPPPAAQAEYGRADAQARGLYRAGGAALAAGMLCGLGVIWTVMRRREDDESDEGQPVER